MKLYRQTDCPITLTSASPTFIQVLNYLLPIAGWNVVNYANAELLVSNKDGKLAKITDATNKAYLTGYRNDQDTKGFPSPFMYNLNGYNAVLSSRSQVSSTSWYLFADDSSFYFVNHGELFGMSYFEPLFDDNETYFVIGNYGLDLNQSVLVEPTDYSVIMFVEGDGTGLEFAKRCGLSLFHRVDDYDLTRVNNTGLLTASVIALHHPTTQQLRGFLPNLFAFNQSFSHEGLVYSQGGYDLYCLVIDGRCFGVRINA